MAVVPAREDLHEAASSSRAPGVESDDPAPWPDVTVDDREVAGADHDLTCGDGPAI